jgi:WD40 repeat protein
MVGWRLAVTGLAVMGAASLAGCQGKGILDPGAQLPSGAGGGVLGGGRPGDAGETSGNGGMASTDARPPSDGGSATAGTITTSPPTSVCALGPARLPPLPPKQASVQGCAGTIPITSAMSVGPAPAGQSYRRCGTLGPETSWQVTLSPDSGHLAARTSAGTVRLYRTDGWQEIAQLASPVGTIDAIAFSPDGARLAGLSGEMGRLTLWNVTDGAPVATFDAPPVSTLGYPLSALAFSSDGRRIATSLGTVVDLQTGAMTTFTGQPVRPYITPVNPAGQTTFAASSTYGLRFVGCDQRLLVDAAGPGGNAGWVEGVSIIDPASGVGVGVGGIWTEIDGLVTSPDSRWVAFIQHGSPERGLHLYDAAGAKLVALDSTAPLFVAGFSRDGTRLYTITDSTIDTREVPTLRTVHRTSLPSSDVTAATVAPRDRVIVSTASASAWVDPDSGVVVRREAFPIADAQFSADGRFGVAPGSGATLFQLWDEPGSAVSCAPAASPPGAAVGGFAVSQDARTLAMVDVSGVVQLRAVDLSGGVLPPSTSVETGVAAYANNISVAVANGGGRVAVAGRPSGTSEWSTVSRVIVADAAEATPSLVHDVPHPAGPLALSPDGAWVAFRDGDGGGELSAVAVSVDSGMTALSISGGTIDSFSADSRQLAIPWGGTMQVWDVAASAETAIYTMPGLSISYAALSPDWSLLGGALNSIPYSDDAANALVWHPEDGRVVRQIGNQRDLWSAPRFDTSNTVVAAVAYATHTLATDWSAWHIWSVADGGELRTFPLSSAYSEPLAILPGGSRVLTRAGTAVAVWCR